MRKRKTAVFHYLLSVIPTAVLSLYLCNPAILWAADSMKAASSVNESIETSANANTAETLDASASGSAGTGITMGDSLFTGAAAAKIPIEVPPGRSNATTPQLELTYSSGGGDGWTGVGWNLALGAVEKSENGYYLVMNGISTMFYERDGAYWPKKKDGTLLKLLWVDSYKQCPPGSIPRGRGHWEAHATDGTRYYFGSSDNATEYVYKWWIAFGFPLTGLLEAGKWYLDRIEDAIGNILQKTSGARVFTYAYNDPLHRNLLSGIPV